MIPLAQPPGLEEDEDLSAVPWCFLQILHLPPLRIQEDTRESGSKLVLKFLRHLYLFVRIPTGLLEIKGTAQDFSLFLLEGGGDYCGGFECRLISSEILAVASPVGEFLEHKIYITSLKNNFVS